MAASILPSGYALRPDYHIGLLPRGNRMIASARGQLLADSCRTILVDEQDHMLVVYFPAADVVWDRLVAIADYTTHCPFKGDATYWALADDRLTPIAWCYATPLAEVASIAGHVAFYQDAVRVVIGG